MNKTLATWIKIGAVMEALAVLAGALLVLFEIFTWEEAQPYIVKTMLGIAAICAASGLIGAVIGRPETETPRA
jgi:nitric oxide reductase large subunit